jgi:hypothetical protein
MDDIVARCPDCGREHPEAFEQCDWCGRNQPSRWWCSACSDWRATRACAACAGGLAVPSEVALGARVVGTTVAFQFAVRNTGKKPVTCMVGCTESAVKFVNPRLLIPAGRAATVSGEIGIAAEPLGRLSFRLVTFDGKYLSETQLIFEAVAPAPRLEFLPALVQLRTANPGGIVRSSVRLKNTGNVPLTANLSAVAAWLAVEPKQLALAPDESAEVKLRARSKKSDSGLLETALSAETGAGAWTAPVHYQLPEPELAAEPVDFGQLQPGRAVFAEVLVRNTGRVRVDGTVEAVAPWMRVTPARVKLQPGREKKVRVRALLTDEDEGPQTSELLVSSDSGILLRVPVTALGKIPRPVLRAVRRQRFRDALGPPTERKFQVANDGDGRLVLTARADVPWIRIVTPELRVAGGKKRKLRYVVDLAVLALGEHSATITIESNGGTATVPVTVHVLEPNPILEIVSGPDLGLLSANQPLSAVVQVRNAGIGLLRVAAESENARNTVSPTETDVPPGPPVRFNLTVPVSGLPGGAHEAAVRFASNGGTGRAVVRFRLPVEQIEVPALLDLGIREAGWPAVGSVRVRNAGPYPVVLRVSGEQPCVQPGVARVVVLPRDAVTVPFHLVLPHEELGPVLGALLLEGRAVRQRVVVRAIAGRAELVVLSGAVELGNMTPGAERPFTVEVENKGLIEARIRDLRVSGELEVWVSKATVDPGERATLIGCARVNTRHTDQQVRTTVPLTDDATVQCTARVVRPILPRVLAVATVVGGLLVSGAGSAAVGWWPGVPLALAGLLVWLGAGAWLFWRER